MGSYLPPETISARGCERRSWTGLGGFGWRDDSSGWGSARAGRAPCIGSGRGGLLGFFCAAHGALRRPRQAELGSRAAPQPDASGVRDEPAALSALRVGVAGGGLCRCGRRRLLCVGACFAGVRIVDRLGWLWVPSPRDPASRFAASFDCGLAGCGRIWVRLGCGAVWVYVVASIGPGEVGVYVACG
jgi:hypothetical protein